MIEIDPENAIIQCLKREAKRKKEWVRHAYGLLSRDWEGEYDLSHLSTEVMSWNSFDNTYQATQQATYQLQKIETLFIKHLMEVFQISPGAQFIGVDFDFVEMGDGKGKFTAQVKISPAPPPQIDRND